MGDLTKQSAAERMGATIRELRQRKKLKLVQIAEQTGLSHSFLSQIERGLAEPSMNSLYRIAQALGTTQDRLIADGREEGEEPIAVLRAGQGIRIPMGDGADGPTGFARQLLSEPGGFYPTEFVGSSREFGEFYEHEGNEFLYVAEGRIEVDLGHATYLLVPGDSLRYPGGVPHRWRSMGGEHTRVLMVHTGVHSNPLFS